MTQRYTVESHQGHKELVEGAPAAMSLCMRLVDEGHTGVHIIKEDMTNDDSGSYVEIAPE